MKTSELTGAALDWAVAKAIGWNEIKLEKNFISGLAGDASDFSTDWALAGPIIEQELIDVQHDRDRVFDHDEAVERWFASKPFTVEKDLSWVEYGPTPLVAAMRCLVASKLGDEVELPEELK